MKKMISLLALLLLVSTIDAGYRYTPTSRARMQEEAQDDDCPEIGGVRKAKTKMQRSETKKMSKMAKEKSSKTASASATSKKRITKLKKARAAADDDFADEVKRCEGLPSDEQQPCFDELATTQVEPTMLY